MTKLSSGFKKVLEASDADTEIIPVLYGYLAEGRLPNPLRVQVRGGTGDRAPDGWFHPSEHPLLTERQLYYYLTAPERWTPKSFPYALKMSALVGSVIHEVVEAILLDLGYLLRPKGTCLSCGLPQPSKCREHGVIDAETGARGHTDGVLGVGGVLRGFELKTAMPMAIKDIRNNDVAAFRKKWPYYYAQVQEYLRMTGMCAYKVIFFAMGNPWDMREFTIEPDLVFQAEVRGRYLAARAAAERGVPPMAGCCPVGSAQMRECPALACSLRGV